MVVLVLVLEEEESVPGGSGVERWCESGRGGQGGRGNWEETGAGSVHIHVYVHKHMMICALTPFRAMAK